VSNLSDMLNGLVTVLEANVTGLKVYDHPPDSVNTFPAAILLPQDIDYVLALAGNSFDFNVDLWLLVSSGDDDRAFALLYDHMDPTATGTSIKAAIEVDRTLNGTVDDAQLVACRNVGRADEWGGWYSGARFIIRMLKKVA